jgi:hypothetical protein
MPLVSGQVLNLGLAASDITLLRAMQLLTHSVVLGLFLMLLTAWGTGQVARRFAGSASEEKISSAEIILGSANVLFLCFGMSGVMLLVSNNLARAFAIGAAIALVRFRIKVNAKTLSMALFYGVLVGMACGVDQVHIAWGITVAFGVLESAVIGIAVYFDRRPDALRHS